jgi:hypothetical protein
VKYLTVILRKSDYRDDQKNGGTVYKHILINEKLEDGERERERERERENWKNRADWEKSIKEVKVHNGM